MNRRNYLIFALLTTTGFLCLGTIYNPPAGAVWGTITGTLSSQSDLNTALGLKAPLASPALTGNPTAPTQTANNNSTRIATTAYVETAVAAVPTPAPTPTPAYLVYTALLTQSGTDAPVATVLQNTLGGTVVWSYTGTGTYTASLADAFTSNKTAVFCSADPGTKGNMHITAWDSADSSASAVQIISFAPSDLVLIDDRMVNDFIEIRVYP